MHERKHHDLPAESQERAKEPTGLGQTGLLVPGKRGCQPCDPLSSSIAIRSLPWVVKAGLLSLALLAFRPAFAQNDDPMLLYDSDGLAVRANFQAGLNVVAEQHLFWDYASTVAPSAHFNPDKQWIEGYIKPGLGFTKNLNDGLTAYGKVSMVVSDTRGTDAYDVGNTGATTLEEGYLGLRSGDSDGLAFDLSFGPREFKAGTGMLLANGGSSGFDRGALKLGPRKAWKTAALGRVGHGNFSGTVFYLKPNELRSNQSGTRIIGSDLRRDGAQDTYVGITYGHVLDSTAPYPKAAPGGFGVPTIIAGGRDGLNFLNVYTRVIPFRNRLENLYVSADMAYEWNARIHLRAWAGRILAGYVFADAAWTPTLSYAYQTFSGDNPHTSTLERFDPLYYEGTPSSWATGSKSSMVFIDSNVNAHQLSLSVSPTKRDAVTLRYAHIGANQLFSPIQFGQATRVDLTTGVPDPIAGVTRKDLADDIYLEYNRVVNANTYLTAGFSVSFPGPGIRSVVNGRASTWTGGFVNVVFNF